MPGDAEPTERNGYYYRRGPTLLDILCCYWLVLAFTPVPIASEASSIEAPAAVSTFPNPPADVPALMLRA